MKLPRFAVRDLFWAISLTAVLFAWGLDHLHLSQRCLELGTLWRDAEAREFELQEALAACRSGLTRSTMGVRGQ